MHIEVKQRLIDNIVSAIANNDWDGMSVEEKLLEADEIVSGVFDEMNI